MGTSGMIALKFGWHHFMGSALSEEGRSLGGLKHHASQDLDSLFASDHGWDTTAARVSALMSPT